MVWAYTPRLAAAFLHFVHKRKGQEAALALHVAAMGARGEPKALKDAAKKLGGDG